MSITIEDGGIGTTVDILENTMSDLTETARRQRQTEINLVPGSREALEATYGNVWSTSELTEDFEVVGFLAPFVVALRRSDGQKGSLEFQANPRFYFNFAPHEK